MDRAVVRAVIERVIRALNWPYATRRSEILDDVTSAGVRPVFSVIDTETTGLSPKVNRTLELAVIRLDGDGRTIDEWVQRFHPDGPVGATHIHGITERDVANAPRFIELLPEINNRLAGTVIVAHNARFDLAFLRAEYTRAGWTLPWLEPVCTLHASHHYLPGLNRRRLPDCCAALGVQHVAAHSALGDARSTTQILRNWLPSRPVWGQLDRAVATRSSVTWPTLPTRTVASPVRPASARPTAAPAPIPNPLGAKLRQIKFSADVPDGTPGKFEVEQYLDKLLDVLEDSVLDSREVAELADLAEVYDLAKETVAGAHRSMIWGLAFIAFANDGIIDDHERERIDRLAGQLGLPMDGMPELYVEAKARWLAAIEADLKPLPAEWALGQPLRVADRIAFSGHTREYRERCTASATELGLRVTSEVSAFTTLIVSDGTLTAQAAAAAEHGTRTVTYREFVELLRHLQPRR